MGQISTRLIRSAKREVTMYDIERRARKVISKDKPDPAPKYPSTVKELKMLDKDKISKDYLHKKDETLDDRLKKVFVTSQDVVPTTQRIIPPDKPLPQARHKEDFFSYGYSESEEMNVPAGRISLKQALDLIIEHKTDPVTNSKPALAAKYKINETVTDDIVEHFRMFNFHGKKALEAGDPTENKKLQTKIEELTLLNSGQILDAIKAWEEKVKGVKINNNLYELIKKNIEKKKSITDKETEKNKR